MMLLCSFGSGTSWEEDELFFESGPYTFSESSIFTQFINFWQLELKNGKLFEILQIWSLEFQISCNSHLKVKIFITFEDFLLAFHDHFGASF